MDSTITTDYIKELRSFFNKEYKTEFTLSKINQSSKDYSYFSLTPVDLKKLKLKFVIILDRKENCVTICLSGQNKSIRKKYWNLIIQSGWDKYHIAKSIDNSLMIVDHTIVKKPNFENSKELTRQIEKEAFIFMDEMSSIL